MISNKPGLELLANIFIKEEITDIVISPGSRNAPMLLTFPEYKEFNIYSIIDERSAGFFALGIAQKTRRPVILNCTSGSALLNYAPAIAEAYYQQIPLIVLSADRPENLIDHGDGQAIRQQDVFHNYIRKSIHLPEQIENKSDVEKYQQFIFEAIEATLFPVLGPVHINIPLAEPLYETKEKEDISLIDFSKKNSSPRISSEKREELKSKWRKAPKKLIIIGQHMPDAELTGLLIKFAEQDTVVLTETTSNMYHSSFVNHIDQVLTQINKSNEREFFPDIIISIGGHIVSKKIKSWLRHQEFTYDHWHISLDNHAPDTFFHLSEHLRSEESEILKQLISENNSASSYTKSWGHIIKQTHQKHLKFIKDIPYSDLKIFSELEKALPQSVKLHFANSTPIRYSQLFSFNNKKEVFCNRGVSGIDGSVSTALGNSIKSDTQSILITGDLSFFYDNNALWNRYIHSNFKIILINNGGGGIFRFIEGPLKSARIDLFETPHRRVAKTLAQEAGMDYRLCVKNEDLSPSLKELIKSPNSQLLEIFTPRELNDIVLKDYFRFLRGE